MENKQDEIAEELCKLLKSTIRNHAEVIYKNTEFEGEIDKHRLFYYDDAFSYVAEMSISADMKDILHVLFIVKEHIEKYGVKSVEYALRREESLRSNYNRAWKKGGRRSIVKEKMREIDAILDGLHDNSLVPLEKREEYRRELIKQLLNDVKEKHSRATYYKVKKYVDKKNPEKN